MWQRERVADVFVQMEISPLSVCLSVCLSDCLSDCMSLCRRVTPAHWMILEQHVLFSNIVHSHKDCICTRAGRLQVYVPFKIESIMCFNFQFSSRI